MADLEKHQDREDWLQWAIEFMRRGIWPEDIITVHGPHSPADYMWGEMAHYTFQTAHGIRGIHDVHGVRISCCGETSMRAFSGRKGGICAKSLKLESTPGK
jgi:hypothetical protein